MTFSVDKNQPTTTISFSLHNGESVQQEFNLTHTVGDVKNFVAKVCRYERRAQTPDRWKRVSKNGNKEN